MSLLDRDPTPEDLEAEREAPRPGLWAGEAHADLRKLTQDETDALIRAELVHLATGADDDAVAQACGMSSASASLPLVLRGRSAATLAHVQRGGIDSDPLVRILARRAWGDRDRQWFELRGVRAGDHLAIRGRHRDGAYGPTTGWCELRWPGEPCCSDANMHAFIEDAVARHDARPGEKVEIIRTSYGGHYYVEHWRVSDRLREPSASDLRFVIGDDGDIEIVVEDGMRRPTFRIDPMPAEWRGCPPPPPPPCQARPPIPPWAREKRGRAWRPGR